MYRRIVFWLVAALVVLIGAIPGGVAPVRAEDEPPVFSITLSSGRETAAVDEPVLFRISKPEPGKIYAWNFGDGSRPESGVMATHQFARIDDFTVAVAAQTTAGTTPLGARVLRVAPTVEDIQLSDSDNQYTPGDMVQLTVLMHAPGLTAVTLRTESPIMTDLSARFELGGDDTALMPDPMRISDERNPMIDQQIIRKAGSSVAVNGDVLVLFLEYAPASKPETTVTIQIAMPVHDAAQPDMVAAITFPNISLTSGMPEEDGSEPGFYLKGDADFSHVDDYYVRKLALEWGRNGGNWSDDPQQIAMNIFKNVDATLDDGEPADFNNDYNMARLFDDGTMSKTKKNSKFICIAQAYFFTGLSRALGFPAREVNSAIGEASYLGNDGVWRVRWWQEGAAELYYNGAWHFFDTWLGFTSRDSYLVKNLAYQSWVTFNPQTTMFMTVNGAPTGLKGHNFNLWPGDPPQWAFAEQATRPGILVDGIDPPSAAPVTAIPVEAARIAAMPMTVRPSGFE